MNLSAYFEAPGAMSMAAMAAAGAAKNAGMISQWKNAWQDRKPGPESAALIERVTAAHAAATGLDPTVMVTCEEARPDLNWTRIADSEYAWHPAGRPVIEVVAPKVETAQA